MGQVRSPKNRAKQGQDRFEARYNLTTSEFRMRQLCHHCKSWFNRPIAQPAAHIHTVTILMQMLTDSWTLAAEENPTLSSTIQCLSCLSLSLSLTHFSLFNAHVFTASFSFHTLSPGSAISLSLSLCLSLSTLLFTFIHLHHTFTLPCPLSLSFTLSLVSLTQFGGVIAGRFIELYHRLRVASRVCRADK